MTARKRRPGYASVNRGVYVDGNTVRKLNRTVRPARPADPERKRRADSRRSRAVKRNQAKALHMDGAYVFGLTVAVIITLFLCVNYLQLQSSITTKINRVEDLELQLNHLKSENDALQTKIDTSVDLDHVYKVATEDLGMVHANKNQILLYDNTESEYVRQNEDIPKQQ